MPDDGHDISRGCSNAQGTWLCSYFFYALLVSWRLILKTWEFVVLGEFWCKNRVWYDSELQSSTGCVQQAENWEGMCSSHHKTKQNICK